MVNKVTIISKILCFDHQEFSNNSLLLTNEDKGKQKTKPLPQKCANCLRK